MLTPIIRYLNGFVSGFLAETMGYEKSKKYRIDCIRDGSWIDGFDLAGTERINLKSLTKKIMKGISNGTTI